MRLKALLSWLKRHWLLVLVIIAFVVFVALSFDDLQGLGAALLQGQWQWVLVATLTQTAYYFLYAVEYKLAFATLEPPRDCGSQPLAKGMRSSRPWGGRGGPIRGRA